MIKSLRNTIASIILATLAAWPFAVTAKEITIALGQFDLTITISAPPWVEQGDTLEQSEVWSTEGIGPRGENVFIQEYIPKGQKFENWTEIYAVLAEMNFSGTLNAYLNQSMASFDQACNDFGIFPIVNNDDLVMVLGFCPSYKSDSTKGEVFTMMIRRKGKTFVKHYYEHRGKSFDRTKAIADARILPGGEDNLKLVGERMAIFLLK